MKFKDLKLGEEFVLADEGNSVSANGGGKKTRRVKYRKILTYIIKEPGGKLAHINSVSSAQLHHISDDTEIEGLA